MVARSGKLMLDKGLLFFFELLATRWRLGIFSDQWLLDSGLLFFLINEYSIAISYFSFLMAHRWWLIQINGGSIVPCHFFRINGCLMTIGYF